MRTNSTGSYQELMPTFALLFDSFVPEKFEGSELRDSVLSTVRAETGKKGKSLIRRWMEYVGAQQGPSLTLYIFLNVFLLFGLSICLIAFGFVIYGIVTVDVSHYSMQFEVPALFAMQSAFVAGIVFLIFAIGLNKKRRKISFHYPRTDDSVPFCTKRRARWAFATAFVLSLLAYLWFSFKISYSPLFAIHGLVFAGLQASLFVSVAMIFSKAFLKMDDQIVNGVMVAMMIFAFVVSLPTLEIDNTFRYEGAGFQMLTLLSLHNWPSSIFFFGVWGSTPLAWLMLFPIGYIVTKGTLSYRKLQQFERTDLCEDDELFEVEYSSLAGNRSLSRSGRDAWGANETKKSTEETVLARIDCYQRTPQTFWQRLLTRIVSRPTWIRLAADDVWFNERPLWSGIWIPNVVVICIVIANVVGSAIWPEDDFTMLLGFGIAALSIVSLVLLRHHCVCRSVQSHLYPVRQRDTFPLFVRDFFLMLPGMIIGSLILIPFAGLTYEYTPLFVLAPATTFVVCYTGLVATKMAEKVGNSLTRITMLFLFAIFSTILGISLLLMHIGLVAKDQELGIVWALIAGGVALIASLAYLSFMLFFYSKIRFDIAKEMQVIGPH